MPPIYQAIGGPLGANLMVNPRRLTQGLGVMAIDMRRGSGDFRPLKSPTPVVADTPAISSLLAGDTKVEGQTLVFTCTLAYATVLAAIYTISWGGSTASGADYTSPPTFTAGVTLISGNTQIVVPAGVSTFEIRFATIDDALVESTEELPLTIGGVTAIGSILDNDAGAYSCPINSFREFTIPTSPEVTYGGNYLNQPPPTAYSANFMYTDIGPSKHGLCWQIGTTTTPTSVSSVLEIVVNDPSVTKANAIYFEYLGAFRVWFDVQNASGVITNNFSSALLNLTLAPDWNRILLYIGGSQNWIKRIRFERDGSTSFGLGFVINVRTMCYAIPEFAPMSQPPLNIIAGAIPGTVTVTPPSTTADTSSYVDSTGTINSAIYYPQDNDGATNYGSTFVLGRPGDAVKTLTIDVNNTAVSKYDGLSFESDGAVRIEVWDEYVSLAGAPSYSYDRITPVGAGEDGKWKQYRSWPLVHAPIGSQGNIKRVRLTALDALTGSTTLTTAHTIPSIWAFQLFPVNSVTTRTDVGSITFY